MRFFSQWQSSKWLGLWLVVGSVLRAWQLGAAPFWYDEIFTARVSYLPLVNMLAATAGDVHPPLFYLLEWAAQKIMGHSEFAMRLIPLACSVAALALVGRAARALGGSERAAVWATALVAVLPFQWQYAREARMYALLQLLYLLTLLAVARGRWVGMALGMAAMLYTHNYGFFYSASLGAWALWQHRAQWRTVLAYGASALLLYAPWAAVMAWQMGAAKATWWSEPTTLGDVLYVPYAVFIGTGLPEQFASLAALVVYAGLCFALARAAQTRAWAALWLIISPVLIALVVEAAYRPVYLNRAFIPLGGLLAVLIGQWLAEQSARAQWAAGAAIAPLVLVAAAWFYPFDVWSKNAMVPQAAATIAAQIEPGDVVFSVNPGSLLTMAQAVPAPNYIIPDLGCSRGGLTARTLEALGIPQAAPGAVEWRRAWVVWFAGPVNGACEDEFVRGLLSTYRARTVMREETKTTLAGVWVLEH